jgi:hypothetical protein
MVLVVVTTLAVVSLLQAAINLLPLGSGAKQAARLVILAVGLICMLQYGGAI